MCRAHHPAHKRLVIDACVAIKWFLPDAPDEANIENALLLLNQAVAEEVYFYQPPHWESEIAGVLARRIPATAADNIEDLLLLDCYTITGSAWLYRRAIAMAQDLGHHLFDTLYHAAAIEEYATFVTADERYFAKAASLGSIALLKSYAP